MLLITFMAGLFTLFGSLLVYLFSNKKKIINFSISLGFGVLSTLILLELIPEAIELVTDNVKGLVGIIIVIGLMFLGIIVLKILDIFIPEHDGKNNLNHVGIMTFITLIIHNILEGMAIYSALCNDARMGVLLALGVALHNIPLGMTISSFFYNEKSNKSIIYSSIISIATLLGGLIVWFFKGALLTDLALGLILSITLGMLVYIVLFELLPHILENKDKKNNIFGIVLGILILIISLLLE